MARAWHCPQQRHRRAPRVLGAARRHGGAEGYGAHGRAAEKQRQGGGPGQQAKKLGVGDLVGAPGAGLLSGVGRGKKES